MQDKTSSGRWPAPVERVLANIDKRPDGCWIWTAAKDKLGYGRTSFDGRKQLAHRLSYAIHRGPIPAGLTLDHLCRVHSCVNPDHLEPVTHQENCRRGDAGKATGAQQRAKTHCPQGHPYDEANTGRYKDERYCRTCQRAHMRAWRKRVKDSKGEQVV